MTADRVADDFTGRPICPVCEISNVTSIQGAHLSQQSTQESTVIAYRCANGHTFVPGSSELISEGDYLRAQASRLIWRSRLLMVKSKALLADSRKLTDMYVAFRGKRWSSLRSR